MFSRPRTPGSGLLEETKRVGRLLDTIVRIQTRPKVWTRKALAQAYEISERRVQEDLEILVHRLRLPLAHCRTGYYFTDVQIIPSITFTFGEAVALLLSASVGRNMAGIDAAELAAALTRLRDAFPIELRRLTRGLSVGANISMSGDEKGQVLEVLEEAIASGTTVQIVYATASRGDVQTERQVDPYALVPYVRSFHLVGYCHHRRDIRIFKVDRIRQIRLTGRRFTIPDDFDVDGYLTASWGLMRGVAREPELVCIRFNSRAGRWVAEERWHPSQHLEWQADGSLLFTLRVGITPAFVRWVLYYGSDAEVLEPAWLARDVLKEARAVIENYDKGDEEKRP